MNTPTTHAIFGTDLTLNPSVLVERIRNELSRLRGQLHDIQSEYPLFKDRLEHTAGALTCVICALAHSNESIVAWEIARDDHSFGPSLRFRSRGVGTDFCPGCFVCGGDAASMNNIAAFVKTKEEGEQIVEWFDGRARLDFRPSEPGWIQIKVGGCRDHVTHLKHLDSLTSTHGRIRRCDIVEAKGIT